MSMMCPPHRVKIVSTPSFFSALATKCPPEMTLASRVLRLSVSSAVVVPLLSVVLVAVSSMDPPFVTLVYDARIPVVAASRGETPRLHLRCFRIAQQSPFRHLRRKGAIFRRQRVASVALASTVADRLVYLLRMGFRIKMANSAARMLRTAAAMNTVCQFPLAAMTLVSGTSSAAVPFAVYMSPVLVVAYVAPKVSVTVEGKRL